MNNAKYWQFKANKLFGLDWKSQFKANNYLFNYLFFYSLMLNSAKTCAKKSQMFIIWQYLTLFDFKKGIRFAC